MGNKRTRRKVKKGKVLLVVLIIAALAAAFILAGGTDTLESIWNRVSGSSSGEYYYDGIAGSSFAAVGDGFVVLSTSQLCTYDGSGENTMNSLISFTSPMLSSSDNYALAWDLDGYDVILVDEDGQRASLTMENSIISASVNDRGYMCVCTDETGYGGSVTVYSPDGTALYKWYSGSDYVLSARMDGRTNILILTLGGDGSELIYAKISEEQESARYSSEEIIIDSGFSEEGIFAITSERLICLDTKLTETGSYDFSGEYLKSYILEENYALVVTSAYQAGGDRTLRTVNTSCDELGSTVLSEVLSVSGADGNIAVLSDNSIILYDIRLEQEWTQEDVTGVDTVSARDDGSVIAFSTYYATVYTGNEKETTQVEE